MHPRRFLPALIACTGLAACASKPDRLPEEALAGSWRNADGVTLSMMDTGVVMVSIPQPKPRSLLGQWSLADGVWTITYLPESKECVDDIGTYRVTVSADAFTASLVRESCDVRRRMIEGSWKRTAAAQPTPGG